MTSRRRFALSWALCARAALVALCNTAIAESAQRGGAVFYAAAPTTDFSLMASRYDVYIVDAYGFQVESIRAADPGRKCSTSRSRTDSLPARQDEGRSQSP